MIPSSRSIKKHVHAQPQIIRIDPGPGWTDILEDEVRDILKDPLQTYKFPGELKKVEGAVEVENIDFRQMLEFPQRLLCAMDVLWQLDSRHVGSFGEFDQFLKSLGWSLYLPEKACVSIRVKSFRSQLYHEGKMEKMAEAILQDMGYSLGGREAPFALRILQEENRCRIFLNLSPDPLFKRSYKADHSHPAPLQEHLAAAAIRWAYKQSLCEGQPDLIYVPFAGSGTLAVETALFFLGRSNRETFPSLEALPEFPLASWVHIQNKLQQRAAEKDALPPIRAVEWDEGGSQTLAKNLGHAGSLLTKLGRPLAFESVHQDVFKDQVPESFQRIWIPLNPPYGLRLGDEEGSRRLYDRIGQWLREDFAAHQQRSGFVLVPDSQAFHAFERKLGATSIKGIHSFTQGGVHIRCVCFSIAPGGG